MRVAKQEEMGLGCHHSSTLQWLVVNSDIANLSWDFMLSTISNPEYVVSFGVLDRFGTLRINTIDASRSTCLPVHLKCGSASKCEPLQRCDGVLLGVQLRPNSKTYSNPILGRKPPGIHFPHCAHREVKASESRPALCPGSFP